MVSQPLQQDSPAAKPRGLLERINARQFHALHTSLCIIAILAGIVFAALCIQIVSVRQEQFTQAKDKEEKADKEREERAKLKSEKHSKKTPDLALGPSVAPASQQPSSNISPTP